MKKKQVTKRFTTADYVKAVKRADREAELQHTSGFKAVTKVHTSKKDYSRREGKKIDFYTLSFCL
ncbi:MAG: hypothetical protein ACOYOT_05975 [Bacteroidales bacterium]